MPQQAMERFIRSTTETEQWQALASDDVGIKVTDRLKYAIDGPDPDDEDERSIPPDELIDRSFVIYRVVNSCIIQ